MLRSMSFNWPDKGRVRAIMALSITAYGMAKGLIDGRVVSAVIFFYFGTKVAQDGR